MSQFLESKREPDELPIPSNEKIRALTIPQNELPEIVLHLNNIYNNVNAAQQLRGVFTMKDCRDFLNAKKELLTFLTNITSLSNGKDLVCEDQKIIDSFAIMVEGCNVQQKTGIFSIEGSVDLLTSIENIEKVIEDNLDPSIKMQRITKKYNDERKKGKK